MGIFDRHLDPVTLAAGGGPPVQSEASQWQPPGSGSDPGHASERLWLQHHVPRGQGWVRDCDPGPTGSGWQLQTCDLNLQLKQIGRAHV